MISLVIMGNGRMGTLIREHAEAARDANGAALFEIVAQVGFDLDQLSEAPAADVIVDFSNAAVLEAVAGYVRRTGAALVSGTTGYSAAQMETLHALGAQAPVLHSGNYSIGVAALRHLVAMAARELPGFDVEICETHHNKKADAPSGTANMLLDAVTSAKESIDAPWHPVFGRQGMCGAREATEIGMHSLRGGTVAGTHTVSFFGPSEELSLTHRAESREIFVNGALAAVQRLVGRPAGVYTFDDIMFGESAS